MALLHDFRFICCSVHAGPSLPLEHVTTLLSLLNMTLLLSYLFSIQTEGIQTEGIHLLYKTFFGSSYGY